jgi:hypothetical protein
MRVSTLRCLPLCALLFPAVALGAPSESAPQPETPAATALTCTGEEGLDAEAKAIVDTFRKYESDFDSFYAYPVSAFGPPVSCAVNYDAENSEKGHQPIDPADFYGTLRYVFAKDVKIDLTMRGMLDAILTSPSGFPDEKAAGAVFEKRAGFKVAKKKPVVTKDPATGNTLKTYSAKGVDAEGIVTHATFIYQGTKLVGFRLH